MRKNGITIMARLILWVRPFIGIMSLTILSGTLGFLAAMGITVLGVVGILSLLQMPVPGYALSLTFVASSLVVFAVFRGVLRYLEQSAGHYIAFKLLAYIRDHIFKALSRLAPAKLDGKDKGQLIALTTSDIELLEVFYAHTIAPAVIALCVCAFVVFVVFSSAPQLVLIPVAAYLTVGVIIPYLTAKSSREHGRVYREQMGDMNSYFLQSLRGMKEVILFDEGDNRRSVIDGKTTAANHSANLIKKHEGRTRAMTETAILCFNGLMLFAGIACVMNGSLTFPNFMLALICLMSSYGPVVALSSLSNNLLQTLASGERVFALLEEEELVHDVSDGKQVEDTGIFVDNICFSYSDEPVIKNVSMELGKNQIIGISGKSGSGKSTLLKLLMRFYDPQSGNILVGKASLKELNTSSLRNTFSYVTQSTYLFNDTILENLCIANRNASMEEIISACKKASIYDYIMSLPDTFHSKVGELGSNLSDGERQRLGLARAFLHPGSIILLDEPTSNLDSLNEAIILKSIKEHSRNKTVILVSHRPSTMSIADKIYYFSGGRVS